MKPKPRRNGRVKGAVFERCVAAQISAWCGFPVTRTPQSGGWCKTGDVTPKRPEDMVGFKFSFELKNNECWHTSQLFEFKGGNLPGCFGKWWKQCSDDAKQSKRIPVLIFTRNRRPVYCVMRDTTFRQLKLHRELSTYIRLGGYRICLWQDILSIPYRTVLERLGKAK